jgi:hypothetical protein
MKNSTFLKVNILNLESPILFVRSLLSFFALFSIDGVDFCPDYTKIEIVANFWK